MFFFPVTSKREKCVGYNAFYLPSSYPSEHEKPVSQDEFTVFTVKFAFVIQEGHVYLEFPSVHLIYQAQRGERPCSRSHQL